MQLLTHINLNIFYKFYKTRKKKKENRFEFYNTS